ARNGASSSKIFVHPAALLAAVVATAFFKSSEARALTDGQDTLTDGQDKSTGGKVSDARALAATIRPATLKGIEAASASAMMNAVGQAAVIGAIMQALQAVLGEREHGPSPAVGSPSDLIDFAGLPPAGLHAVSSLSQPVANWEVEHGGAIQVSQVQLPT